MGWPKPSVTLSAVRAAGDRIRKCRETSNDVDVLNTWRAAHGYIINTFQASLRQRTRGLNSPVAQRLKRATTITDKLRQGRAKDLSSMHDIAGMRLVFSDVDELDAFRLSLHRTKAKHVLVNDIEKYDYIKRPKSSGYRGVHDVYSYVAGTTAGASWNGLQIEIQYRTTVQHSWATAVELSDVITQNRTKFSQGDADSTRFFQICSELLARGYENLNSCLPMLTYQELAAEWHEIENRAHLFRQLKSIGQDSGGAVLSGYVLLIMHEDMTVEQKPMKSYREAVHELLRIELEFPNLDVVLVGGEGDTIRQTFRNYFKNASEFVSLMNDVV